MVHSLDIYMSAFVRLNSRTSLLYNLLLSSARFPLAVATFIASRFVCPSALSLSLVSHHRVSALSVKFVYVQFLRCSQQRFRWKTRKAC